MAAAPGRTRCVTCGKERATSKCGGCLQDLCYNDFEYHHQELSKQLDEIEFNCDLYRLTLTEQTADLQKHPLIQEINNWERNSIDKIKQAADEARQLIFEHTSTHATDLEDQLNKLTVQLRQCRQENDFFDTDLNQWKDELERLAKELTKLTNVKFCQESTPFVTKISIDLSCAPLYISNVSANTRWFQNGVTVAGDNSYGNRLDKLYYPYGMYIDDDQTVYIADNYNHRVMQWKSGARSGEVVAGGNGKGNRTDQLNNPTDIIIDKESNYLIVCDQGNRRIMRWPLRNGISGEIVISGVDCAGIAMDNDRNLYISDYRKHEVSRWREGYINGTVVAGGNGAGNRIDQLNFPTYIFIDQNHSVYVSDHENHRVIKWMKGAKEGIVVAGDQSRGNSLSNLSRPYAVMVDQSGTVYVADSSNHRVMRWNEGATQGSVIVGGNGQGGQPNQFNCPTGLSFDRQNNLYVVDHGNNRVQKFNIDSSSNT